jgi:hypothetical protein
LRFRLHAAGDGDRDEHHSDPHVDCFADLQPVGFARSLISQYTLDKQKAPQSLDDLIQGGYLKSLPRDPMTNESNWEVVQEDVLLSADQQDPGINDVHSASSQTGTDGTAYSTW